MTFENTSPRLDSAAALKIVIELASNGEESIDTVLLASVSAGVPEDTVAETVLTETDRLLAAENPRDELRARWCEILASVASVSSSQHLLKGLTARFAAVDGADATRREVAEVLWAIATNPNTTAALLDEITDSCDDLDPGSRKTWVAAARHPNLDEPTALRLAKRSTTSWVKETLAGRADLNVELAEYLAWCDDHPVSHALLNNAATPTHIADNYTRHTSESWRVLATRAPAVSDEALTALTRDPRPGPAGAAWIALAARGKVTINI